MSNELLTREDLQQFRLQLLKELREVFSQPKHSAKKWLKSSEVRKLLGISAGTLQTLRTSGHLPYTKLGSLMFYRQEDIDRILEANFLRKAA